MWVDCSPSLCLPEISRIIQVDLDVEYRTNIWELFEEFDNFPEGAVIGIAREMQPVYRCVSRQEGGGAEWTYPWAPAGPFPAAGGLPWPGPFWRRGIFAQSVRGMGGLPPERASAA